MKHGHTMRTYARAFLAFAAIGMAGACADQNVVAPTASKKVRAFKVPANFSVLNEDLVFTVNNAQGVTQHIGNHVLYMPAGAICDPSSGYGPTEWDQPCTPLSGSMTFTATVLEGPNGEPYVDFQPSVRFSPSKEVMLFLLNTTRTAALLTIKYCTNVGECYDESLTDASLKPFRVGTSSMIGRRVKHFTGYVVFAEWECPPPGTVTVDSNGTMWCSEGGFERRSGYMVASGQREESGKDANKEGKKNEKEQEQEQQ